MGVIKLFIEIWVFLLDIFVLNGYYRKIIEIYY